MALAWETSQEVDKHRGGVVSTDFIGQLCYILSSFSALLDLVILLDRLRRATDFQSQMEVTLKIL